jgi:hypothetical protein
MAPPPLPLPPLIRRLHWHRLPNPFRPHTSQGIQQVRSTTSWRTICLLEVADLACEFHGVELLDCIGFSYVSKVNFFFCFQPQLTTHRQTIRGHEHWAGIVNASDQRGRIELGGGKWVKSCHTKNKANEFGPFNPVPKLKQTF